MHQDHNHNDSRHSNILTTKLRFPNQYSKISVEPHMDFGILKHSSEFSRHNIESTKRKHFENSGTMQRDSETTINLNWKTQLSNRQISFPSSSNSSSTTAIQCFETQPNSGKVINNYPKEKVTLRPRKKGNYTG